MPAKIDPDTIVGFTSDVDKAYAAGFFDGEGHVHYRKNKKAQNGKEYAFLHVSIGQQDARVLLWLQSIWAGNIYEYKNKAKPFFQWSIVGTRAQKFIDQISPYLRVKDKQTAALLELAAVEVVDESA